MADELNINVNAKLDPDASAVQINNGLDELYKSGKINPVNVSVKLDTDAIKSQTSQVQTQINNIAKANSSGFKVPIDFNVSADKIKEQLTTIVNKIRGGAKGQVIDFKVNLDEDGFLSDKSNVLIKYRNDANQVTESILKLKDTKEKLDDGTSDLRWTETLKSVSQNIEQTTKKAEQLTSAQQKQANSISELSEKYKTLQIQMSKLPQINGTNSLNSENIKGFQNAINANDVQQATHYLNSLRIEYQQLNAEMSKKLPPNAIDNMKERARSLSTQIDQITAKFSTLNTNGNFNFTKNFSTQIKQAGTSIKSLQNNLNAFNTAKTEQEQVTAFNQLNNSVKDSKIQVNDLVKTYQTLNRIEASSGSFEKYVQQNPQVLKKHAQEVADIKNQWEQVAQETDITKLQTGFKEANTATSAFKGEIRSLGQEGRTAFGELGNDLKKIFQWTVSGGLLFGAIGQIKEGIQTINSLNKSMTDIQMITGMSASKVGNLTKQYSDLASQLHETTTSIMTASEEFLRAGNSADETASLLKASTVMSKIAGQTQEESAQSLISIMNAYKMKASDMMSVVDKLVAVDNTSATSTEELSTAIQKTAASAQESGVSFSQLVSWIGEVSSVSRQSADTIGTAFNSIFSRYEKVKAGANTDDQGEAVNDVEKVLKKFDISIRDQSNNFINFNTVLTEVANKWSTLNTVERGQISTALAGTKQRNQFLILMQNFNKTLELQSTEANSAGNAMNRYGTYATSTQAKIDDFINTLQKFWQNVVNSSVINGVVGAGTDVINVISGINSKLGAIPTLIGAITAALSVTKNVGKIYAYAA